MSITSVLATGLNGIQRGISLTDRAGAQIAQIGSVSFSEQLATSMVGLREGELQTKFGADVVKVADQLLGTLIDIRA